MQRVRVVGVSEPSSLDVDDYSRTNPTSVGDDDADIETVNNETETGRHRLGLLPVRQNPTVLITSPPTEYAKECSPPDVERFGAGVGDQLQEQQQQQLPQKIHSLSAASVYDNVQLESNGIDLASIIPRSAVDYPVLPRF